MSSLFEIVFPSNTPQQPPPLPINPNRDLNVQWFEEEVRRRLMRIEKMLEAILKNMPTKEL
jgi:hypothetical protein